MNEYSFSEKTVDVWTISMKKGNPPKPVIKKIRINTQNNITQKRILKSDVCSAECIDFDARTGYMFVYDRNQNRPFSSVIVYRYSKSDSVNIGEDIQSKDQAAMAYAISNYLT